MEEQQSAADSPDEFCVIIKTWDGKRYSVPVSLDDTVWEVKVKLNAQESCWVPESGGLIYGSKYMKDNLTLRHYNVTPNSLLHHILRCKWPGTAREDPSGGHILVLTEHPVQRGWWSCLVVSVGPQLTAGR
ncbi:UBIQ protein, partial [Pluvianellus socialis]|nr:UBIQ protein [Pluvianellus socialis]